MPKLSPMMEQYFEIKEQFKDSLLFFRLGDFYEMFFDDAIIMSKELDLTLTGRDCGMQERAPMCGVPFHSVDGYIAKLVEKGYHVAICEQTEEPKPGKGIVKRDVLRVITPGTILDQNALDATKNNYICSVYLGDKSCAVAFADISTGEFCCTEFPVLDYENKVLDEIGCYCPSELIANRYFKNANITQLLNAKYNLKVDEYYDWAYEINTATNKLQTHFGVTTLRGFGLNDKTDAISASGALLSYLYDTQKNSLNQIVTLKYYALKQFMSIDSSSRRNLELTETIHAKGKKGSLLWILDKTKTPMGARQLRKWITQPLIDVTQINNRLESVKSLTNNYFLTEEISDVLKTVNDFERIMSKVTNNTANARELSSLRNSIKNLPQLKEALTNSNSTYLMQLHQSFDDLSDIFTYLDRAIADDPPFGIKEGGIIKDNYNEEIAKLRLAQKEGSAWLSDLEEKERGKTGIRTLKIKYNKLFGYCFEVTKSYISSVPDYFIRKQTLSNCERYTTTELADLEEQILSAENTLTELEYSIFCEIRTTLTSLSGRILGSANNVAIVDTLLSLSIAATQNAYVMPKISDNGIIRIKAGRHPVVENFVETAFIPNDTYLDMEDDRLSIITGPNMAGKSTYMRQVALIVLMAQIGSFVPSAEAEIGIVDKIFTRVGASDDLASGYSTFMVEMTEVSNILNTATGKSLVILDEIGRGTSTFDGLSIAWSVVEFIADKKNVGARTLFATHYHELTELEGRLPGVKNYCISIKEQGDDIVFLRKIIRGGASYSYGIQVAKLAGLPISVVKRSKEILKDLNAADIAKKAKKIAKNSMEKVEEASMQMNLQNIKENQLSDELLELNLNQMSPLDALQALYKLQNKAKGL